MFQGRRAGGGAGGGLVWLGRAGMMQGHQSALRCSGVDGMSQGEM